MIYYDLKVHPHNISLEMIDCLYHSQLLTIYSRIVSFCCLQESASIYHWQLHTLTSFIFALLFKSALKPILLALVSIQNSWSYFGKLNMGAIIKCYFNFWKLNSYSATHLKFFFNSFFHHINAIRVI